LFQPRATPERLNAFCDGVFAALITVLVLDLRPPELPTFSALLLRWPTWLSYAVSYLFIAIVWTNHHYLIRFATAVTPRLLWFNFAHLFSVSLLPLSTAWMAVSELAPQPVAFYAAVFFLVNATYILLIRELIDRTGAHGTSPGMRRSMRVRSIATLCLFGGAAVVALRYPLLGLAICCGCLVAYLKPDAHGLGTTLTAGQWNGGCRIPGHWIGGTVSRTLLSARSRTSSAAVTPSKFSQASLSSTVSSASSSARRRSTHVAHNERVPGLKSFHLMRDSNRSSATASDAASNSARAMGSSAKAFIDPQHARFAISGKSARG